jgi:hypothetical protein
MVVAVLAGAALAAALLLAALRNHAWLIAEAFSKPQKADATSDPNISSLFSSLTHLANDATEVIAPVASLGGIAGGLMWAAGSQRGQSLLIGAVSGGVLTLAITGILN